MPRYNVTAELHGKEGSEPTPLQTVKRSVFSPVIENGVLLLDDLGFRLPDGHSENEVVIRLSITRAK